jgi:hypothetical protein
MMDVFPTDWSPRNTSYRAKLKSIRHSSFEQQHTITSIGELKGPFKKWQSNRESALQQEKKEEGGGGLGTLYLAIAPMLYAALPSSDMIPLFHGKRSRTEWALALGGKKGVFVVARMAA